MAAEYDVLSEIEVLQSIYLDELHVASTCDGSWEVSLVLYPSTAEDSVSQFVRLTLKLTLDQQYPSSSPSITIHNPRGLSDDMLGSVRSCLQAEAESCLGSPVLYQLIEKAKEILTESNIPHGNCVICLYGFKESEAFTKTSCYHYFHSHCLGRYVTHSEEEVRQRQKEREQDKTQHGVDLQELTVVCPVCREPLTYDAGQLLSSPAPLFPKQEGVEMGTDFRQKWQELQELLERQRAKGGIIDPDVESNRFLIRINEVPSEGENGDQDAVLPPGQAAPLASALPAADVVSLQADQPRADQPRAAPWPCRGGPGHRRQGPFKGPRRGGRGRPHPPGRPSPPTESLNKLHLASDGSHHYPSSHTPIRAKPRGQLKTVEREPAPTKTDREGLADLKHRETPESTGRQQTRPPTSGDPDCPPGFRELESGPDKRGRRRGYRPGDSHQQQQQQQQQQPGQWHERHARGSNQGDPPGGRHHHWEGRGSGSSGGGYRRGPNRGAYQKVVERDAGREEVL